MNMILAHFMALAIICRKTICPAFKCGGSRLVAAIDVAAFPGLPAPLSSMVLHAVRKLAQQLVSKKFEI